MKLRTKLLLAYLIVTAFVSAVLYVGFNANRMADQAFDQATVHVLPVSRALRDLRTAAMRIVSSTSEHLFLATAGRAAARTDGVRSEVEREAAHEARLAEEAEREFERALQRYRTLSERSASADVISIRDITKASGVLQSEARGLRDVAASRTTLESLLSGKERFEAAEMRLLRLIDSATAREELRINGIFDASMQQLQDVRKHYVLLVAFLALTALGIGVGFTCYVSRPMRALITRAARIERGESADGPSQGATGPDGLERRQRRRNSDELQELSHAFDAMEQRLEDSRQRLRAHQDNLTAQVALRTLDLENALKRAESLTREARAASDAKAAFLANMSHEIRTPLNGVIGTAELLSHTELSAHQHELVHTITRSGDNLLRIINDILDFSKIDAGRLDLDHAPFTPGATLEEVAALLAPGAHSKTVELIADIHPSTYVTVLGDAGRLRQIILNLMSNAIKFTEGGQVCMMARAKAAAEDHITLRIDIQDSGIGMSEEVQRRLFQPFSQADASTTRRFGGTGLGLAISRQLAELMHGTLNLDSVEGQGTTCTLEVVLPIHTASRMETVEPGRGIEVLLHMAHPAARQAAAMQLRSLGFHAETAASLQEAAEIANRKTFAVIMAEGLDTEPGARLASLATTGGTELVPIGPFAPPAGGMASRVRLRLAKPVLRSQILSFLRHRGKTPASAPRPGALPMRILDIDARDEVRALVAEDNAVNRMVALQMLKRLGIDARAVNNGAEAAAAQIETPYDVILMDCQMPEMDGYESTRAIRDHEREHDLKHVPIIALTANALKGDRERTLEAGMDDYLSKPVTLDTLANMLEKWLSRRTGSERDATVN